MYRTFNCGVGMVICLPASGITQCLTILAEHGINGWVLGSVEKTEGQARVELNV
jgi:phosphoribosylformylglycinamidine cyclo-ligase